MKKGLLKIGNTIGSIVIIIYSIGFASGIVIEAFLDPNKEIVMRGKDDQESISSDEEETKE